LVQSQSSGNPNLFLTSTKSVRPHNFEEYKKQLEAEEAAIDKSTASMDKHKKADLVGVRMPLLIRVNIYYPTESGELEKFWYSGFYIVNKISNKFIDGDFSQTLELMAYNVGYDFDELARKMSAKESAAAKSKTSTPRTKKSK
jgi:hypothetical protein